MPYPIAHVLFFVLCISAVMVYVTLQAIIRKEFSALNCINFLLLFFVGAFCALLPDVTAVYNLLVNGNTAHCYIGSFPTHSLLFSLTAILFGAVVGYVVYRKYDKAIYVSIYAESAFISHLLLDDIARNEIAYFYPLYMNDFSIFAYVDRDMAFSHFTYYTIGCYVGVLAIFGVLMMALFALEHLGFEFKYRP